MTSASVNGVPVSSGRVLLPLRGAWTAELQTAEAGLDGAAWLVLGGRTLVGTISGDDHGGIGRWSVVAGAGRWRTTVARRGYASPTGVRGSTVLSDLARDAGEVVEAPATDSRLGLQYARPAGPADLVLDHLAGSLGWYVDDDGTTRLGARTASTAPSFVLLDWQPQDLLARVSSESPELFEPGQVVSLSGSSWTIESIEHAIDRGRWTVAIGVAAVAATEGRLESALRATVRRFAADVSWCGSYSYRVVSCTAGLLDLEPSSTSAGMPPLARVPLRCASGLAPQVRSGSSVIVQFIDRDPGRPFVVACDEQGGDWEADGLAVDVRDRLTQTVDVGDALGAVVRYGDRVSIAGIVPAAALGTISFVPDPPLGPLLPSILRG